MNNLTQLPKKWCIEANESNWMQIRDFIYSKGYPSWRSYSPYYIHFPFSIYGGSAYSNIQFGYTQITFDQFKEWVLNETPIIKDTYPIY
jgi:hypothetical protein